MKILHEEYKKQNIYPWLWFPRHADRVEVKQVPQSPIYKSTEPSNFLVNVATPESSKENKGVTWSSTPDQLPHKPFQCSKLRQTWSFLAGVFQGRPGRRRSSCRRLRPQWRGERGKTEREVRGAIHLLTLGRDDAGSKIDGGGCRGEKPVWERREGEARGHWWGGSGAASVRRAEWMGTMKVAMGPVAGWDWRRRGGWGRGRGGLGGMGWVMSGWSTGTKFCKTCAWAWRHMYGFFKLVNIIIEQIFSLHDFLWYFKNHLLILLSNKFLVCTISYHTLKITILIEIKHLLI
jgi:hypothetical protein